MAEKREPMKTEDSEIKITPIDNALEITAITNEVKKQKQQIADLSKRIDRIVDAIAKSKRVKGL